MHAITLVPKGAIYLIKFKKMQCSEYCLPHALASDGHRWHVRAFDTEKTRFSDFVLSRLKETKPGTQPEQEVPEDSAWTTYVDIVLKPDPSLDQSKRECLEFEYEMNNGRLRLTVRQAMLFYYLRHYGFDPRQRENCRIRNKSSFFAED